MKDKEIAIKDFMANIRKSWTWAKLTVREQAIFGTVMDDNAGKIRGTYEQRYETAHMLYDMYINGLGYDGPEWRA